MLEIAAAVAAPRGDHGVEPVQPVHHFHLLPDAGADRAPALKKHGRQPGVIPARLDPNPVSGHDPTDQIVQTDKRDVARHDDAQGLGLGLSLRPVETVQPSVHGVRCEGRAPDLGGMLDFGPGEPPVGMFCPPHGGMQWRPSRFGRIADGGGQAFSEGGEHRAGTGRVDRSGGSIVGFHGDN